MMSVEAARNEIHLSPEVLEKARIAAGTDDRVILTWTDEPVAVLTTIGATARCA